MLTINLLRAMGTYDGSLTVDLEYPMAFVESMGRVLEKRGKQTAFRFVLLSGKFVRQNQDQKLYLFEKPRKIKVFVYTSPLAFLFRLLST